MSRRKLKSLPESLQRAMIDNNMVDRNIYKSPGNSPVIKHEVDRRKKAGFKGQIVMATQSRFYSEAELVNNVLRDEMQRLNAKPVIDIDPTSIQIEKSEMTQAEKAFMLARKYRYDDPTYTLKKIWQANKIKKMNDRDIKTVMDMVEQIKGQLQESSQT